MKASPASKSAERGRLGLLIVLGGKTLYRRVMEIMWPVPKDFYEGVAKVIPVSMKEKRWASTGISDLLLFEGVQ